MIPPNEKDKSELDDLSPKDYFDDDIEVEDDEAEDEEDDDEDVDDEADVTDSKK
jgi:hypothetical protein